MIKLNLKSIMMYEAMTGNSYQDICNGSEEDTIILMYSMYMCNEKNKPCTIERFREILRSDAISKAMAEDLNVAMSIVQRIKVEYDSIECDIDSDVDSVKLSDIAARLISFGLDASYVMYNMELWELPIMLKAYENKRREDMEASRLWTFYAMSPHIDTKKISTPQDLFPFPWEKDVISNFEKEVEESINIAEAINNTYYHE